MTRGISEERLRDIYERVSQSHLMIIEQGLLRDLISECKELKPWLPIEQAPKDRPILLFIPGYGQVTGRVGSKVYGINGEVEPTHYQELPEDSC